eukprot:jgi/Picsp_1/4712/NSC_02081-R1_---NA---
MFIEAQLNRIVPAMSIDRVTNSLNNGKSDWDGDTRCYCGLLAAVERKESSGQCVYRCPKGICDPESCGFVLRLPEDDKNAIVPQHHRGVKDFEAAVTPGTGRKVFNCKGLVEGRSNVETSDGSLTQKAPPDMDQCDRNQGLDKISVELCTIQESLVEVGDAVLRDGVPEQTSNLEAPHKRSREPFDGVTGVSESTNCNIYTKFCLRCDGKGHWGKECRLVAEEATVLRPASEQQKEAGPFVAKSSEGKCFHCQGEGHWAKHCPVKRRKQDDCSTTLSFPGNCAGTLSQN